MRVIPLLLAVSWLWAGCKSTHDPAADQGSSATAVAESALPPLSLSDTTANLLLTWIDAEGDFHVVEKIADIPVDRRSQVRVVVTDQPAGTGPQVYVADLTSARADGTYAVNTLSRVDWEKLGADRRKARLEALAPTEPGNPTSPTNGESPSATPLDPIAAVSAIIYGADWCKPCHDAEHYLKTLGVSVTKKNIEESRAAQAEMQQKLARVNRRGAGIPVIDVMGKILVGFSPGSLKQAVDAARNAATTHRQG